MTTDALSSAMAHARETLLALEDLLRELPDADLHRAEPGGGWTCAQVVSHIHLCGLLWIADLERLAQHPGQAMFMFREELGHDAVGASPPSSRDAAERLASLREAMERCMPAVDPAVLSKSLEVPTLRTMTVAVWLPLIMGHLAGHADQLRAILRSRGVMPAAVA